MSDLTILTLAQLLMKKVYRGKIIYGLKVACVHNCVIPFCALEFLIVWIRNVLAVAGAKY